MSETLTDRVVDLWPLGAGAATGIAGWIAATLKTRKAYQGEIDKKIDDLRDRYNSTERELAVIRAVLAAATGKPIEQITLQMVQDIVARHVTVQELETFILTMPRLVWVKKRLGPSSYKMVQVSQVYADKYLGGPASMYTGRTDHEIWPSALADIFAVNDEEAYVSGDIVDVRERVMSPLTGVRGTFVGTKWSFRLGQDSYICGLGVHEDPAPAAVYSLGDPE